MKKAHCHIFIVNEAAIQLIEDTVGRKIFIESSKYKFVASQKWYKNILAYYFSGRIAQAKIHALSFG